MENTFHWIIHVVLLATVFLKKTSFTELFSRGGSTNQEQQDIKLNTYLEVLNAIDLYLDKPKSKRTALEMRVYLNKLILISSNHHIIETFQKIVDGGNNKESAALLSSFRSLLRKDLGFDKKLL